MCITRSSIPCYRSVVISVAVTRNGVILRGNNVSNMVAGSLQRDNFPGMHCKKRQWSRYANEHNVEQNASIGICQKHCVTHLTPEFIMRQSEYTSHVFIDEAESFQPRLIFPDVSEKAFLRRSILDKVNVFSPSGVLELNSNIIYLIN